MWFMRVEKLLSAEQLKTLDELIAKSTFVDGKLTAGRMARQVKKNEQLDRREIDETIKDIDQLLLGAIHANTQIRAAAVPARIAPPLIARYDVGMTYGFHSDNPIIPTSNGPVRTDVSITIFLSNPNDYEGGVLEVETTAGRIGFKLPRGDAIMYPSGEIHQVSPVTKGERRVAVTWIQSRIADARKRGIIYDVGRMVELITKGDVQSPQSLLAGKVHGDLMRMWADG